MIRKIKLLNKTLIIGVFILLIGVAFTPSICGDNKKIRIQSEKKSSNCSPISDDYINSYWEFNECSGDIVGDSSSPHYNGTRHGATWAGGGSDCALLFDGVDDYVNFSTYAAEIFFNKTDDFIISFMFKSTGEGTIFSGTAPWGFNPDFQIELCSNGSLLFKLIGSSHLGITLYSLNSYNDGSYHFVEYYHNGISTNPTVSLYVDNNFDNSMTSYYYNIENDEYTKAKMGMNAHSSTSFFDGYLEDFKIVKYEQGNDQEPPIISGPTGGLPGEELEFKFVTDDPEGDDIWILIDWDDGTEEDWRGPYKSGEEVTVIYQWYEEGTYNITAKSKDIWDDSKWSDPFKVIIGNQHPDPPTITGQKYGDPDQELTYTFLSNDFENQDIKYHIDWDDGTTSDTNYYPSGTPVDVTHSWENEGDYSITAYAIDIQGKQSQSQYHIRIGDQPPNKPEIEGPNSGQPDTEIDFIIFTNDPDSDNIWYDIRWGDGNEIIDDGPYNSGEPITKSHSWNNTNTYKIEVRARDNFEYYSEWESFTIKIPRNKGFFNNMLELFFERFLNKNQLFRYVLGFN
jgi:hypothetical protein